MAFRLCSPSAMPFIEHFCLVVRRQSNRNSRLHRGAELVQPELPDTANVAGTLRWRRLFEQACCIHSNRVGNITPQLPSTSLHSWILTLFCAQTGPCQSIASALVHRRHGRLARRIASVPCKTLRMPQSPLLCPTWPQGSTTPRPG